MSNLVVCSATGPSNPIDNAMFSDFKKISSALMLMETQTATANTFLSCFPLEEHLKCLSIKTTPTAETESRRPESSSGLGPVFTDHDCIRNKQVLKETKRAATSPYKDRAFHGEVVRWIMKKADEAQPGDTVNISFQGHGTPGNILIGKKVLNNNDLVPFLQQFFKRSAGQCSVPVLKLPTWQACGRNPP